MARTAPAPNIPPTPGMNPGAWVAGGGGAGGGKGGKGGGAGNGNEGADGEEGGENAEGDGNGAGACGEGATGSCTNCSDNPQAGDPVNVLTGEVFTVPKTDLFLRGFFNLQIDRSYNSGRRFVDVGLGFGWSHNLAWSIRTHKGKLIVRDPKGATVEFPCFDGEGYQSSAGSWALIRKGSGYLLRAGNEFFHYFLPDPDEPSSFRLARVSYRNRGALTLLYDGKRLARVVDTAGRNVDFSGTPDGRITGISVTADDGARIDFARYDYDAAGRLVSATDADGHVWQYRYDDDNRLLEMRLPTGLSFHYLYDRTGRCVETWGADRNGSDPALSADVPELLADGKTRAKGILHAKLDYLDDDTTEVVDSVRVQRFTADASGGVATGVSAGGGVTTREYDDRGQITAIEDANGGVTRKVRNGMGHVIREIDPEGSELSFARDREGRIVEVTDPLGGKVRATRNLWGNVEMVTHQDGSVETFRYDSRGRLIEHADKRGATTKFAWDAHGNCVQRTLPNQGSFIYEFDYWGRCVRETLPTGETFAFQHSRGGKLIRIDDSAGRSLRYAFDGLGNVTAITRPDSRTTRYRRNGLGWLLGTTHPTGERSEAIYNREGWLMAYTNEAGQTHRYERDVTGRAVREEMFNGRSRGFRCDLMGRVVQVDEGSFGITEFERNLLGQVVTRTCADGTEVAFEYDARHHMTGAALPDVRTEFERDATGNIVLERHSIGEHTYEVECERAGAGERRSLKTSMGLALHYTRDAMGNVASVNDGVDSVIRYERDAMGTVVRRDLPRGGAIVDRRDAARRLRHRQVERAGQRSQSAEPDWVGTPGNGDVFKTYDYSPVDEITSTLTATGQTLYEYDALHHLVRKEVDGSEEFWSTDAIGNYTEAGVGAVARRYLGSGMLAAKDDIEYLWDARGFLTEKRRTHQDGSTERWLYTWSSLDQLACVELPDGTKVSYEYDSFARCVARRASKPAPAGGEQLVSAAHYVWDKDTLLHEVDVTDGEAKLSRTYLFADENDLTPVGHATPDGEWVYYVGGVNDAPEELVDAGGQTVGRLDWNTFGALDTSSGSGASTRVRMLGQYADPDTGLYYNRYRFYDPDTGRYISPDPIGPAGGSNLYAYGPNPIAWVDPFGLQHYMLAEGPGVPFSEYNAGPGPNSDPAWNNQDLRNHTERQFLRDLQASGQTGGNAECLGQFPPCPHCHRYLQQHADNSGTTIEYSWNGPPPNHEPQSITYQPGQAPTGSGTDAELLTGDPSIGLVGAYEMSASDHASGYEYDGGFQATANPEYQRQRDAIQAGPH